MKHVIELISLLIAVTLSWATMRARIDDAMRQAKEANANALTAHRRLNRQRDEGVALRLHIREMRVKLDTLTDCVQQLNAKLDETMKRMSDFQESLAVMRGVEQSE